MKQISWLVSLWVLAIFFPGCREEELARPGNIQFALNPSVVADGQGRKATSLPDGASIFVSIRRVSGDEVYNLHEVRLFKVGDGYISEPLALAGGNYELTDFLVADGTGGVVYASPKEGSDLAMYVEDPLPQTFAVSDDAIAQVTVQVLSTDAHQPQQFGYVTFRVDVVMPPVFQLAVFKPEGGGLVFSRAHVYLVADDDTVFYQYVPAQTNTINFTPQPGAQYRLMLYENGFKRYDQYLQPADFTGEPLKVVLEPAFTFVLINPHGPISFSWTVLEGNEDKVFWVDFGDGRTAGEYTIGTHLPMPYEYSDNSPRFVSISGNLDVIDRVLFGDVHGSMDSVSVQHLPALEVFYVPEAWDTPATIDFSQNPNLSSIYMEFSSLSSLDVSHNPLLRYIPINGSTHFTTASVDAFITSLYNAITRQPPGPDVVGYLNIADGYRDSMVPIGPPSEEARAKLRTLANTYGWGIHPQTLLQQP